MGRNKRPLTMMAVTMINIVAVDSFRTLPIAAQYGFSLVFYFLIGGIFFLIPSALVAAELGTSWKEAGGIYIWLREAFGKKHANTIIWINWIYNLSWYPTIMSLIAGVFAYLVNPALANNKYYMITAILFFFWLSTILNCLGIKTAAWVSKIGAILGTLVPMIGISLLAAYYYYSNQHLAIEISEQTFFPHDTASENLTLFSSIIFALLGLELVATHSTSMRDPVRDYPRSLLISVIFIISSITLASLAIAMVVPRDQLQLGMEIIDAFDIFFHRLNIPIFTHLIAVSIVLGGLANVHAWTLGPAKGLMIAAKDRILPTFLTKADSDGTPIRALILQGVIVTVLSSVYMFMPTLNGAFVFLTIITSQLAMIVYIAVFAAAIRLRYTKKSVKREFKIPGGMFGIWLTGMSGIITCSIGFFTGFVHPSSPLMKNVFSYDTLVVGVMILLTLLPYLFVKVYSK